MEPSERVPMTKFKIRSCSVLGTKHVTVQNIQNIQYVAVAMAQRMQQYTAYNIRMKQQYPWQKHVAVYSLQYTYEAPVAMVQTCTGTQHTICEAAVSLIQTVVSVTVYTWCTIRISSSNPLGIKPEWLPLAQHKWQYTVYNI